MSNNLCHRNLYKENCAQIKLHCYSVTMGTTKFIQPELNRAIQEELIDTKFPNFGEGLVLALSRYNKTYIAKYIHFLWK